MKVSELIEELRRVPEHREVVVAVRSTEAGHLVGESGQMVSPVERLDLLGPFHVVLYHRGFLG